MYSSYDFVISDGVLTALQVGANSGGVLIIPEGVTTLTRNFLGGDSVWHSLTRVVLPDSLQKIEGPAEPYDGIGAFSGCKNLIEVIFPNHKVEVACRTFFGCSALKRLTMTESSINGMMFATRKSVEMTVLRENQEPAHVVAIFRNAHFYYEGNVEQDYLLPLTPKEAVHYDKLLAAGSHEGFTVSEDGRVKAMLLRLQDENLPVDEAYRKIFAEYLAQKLNKVLKFAEEDGSPSYIHALIALRLVNADNKKKVQKKLEASAHPELRELAGAIAQHAAAPDQTDDAASEQTDAGVPSKGGSASFSEDPFFIKVNKQLKKIAAGSVLMKCGLMELPPVLLAESGQPAPPEYLTLLIAEYVRQSESRYYAESIYFSFSPLADEAAKRLDKRSLMDTLQSIFRALPDEKAQRLFLPVLFRYGDGPLAVRLFQNYRLYYCPRKLRKIIPVQNAVLLNDSQEALLLADANHKLHAYAEMRGLSEDILRDQYLYDIGLDAQGTKSFDLGNGTVSACLQPDLSFLIEAPGAKKPSKTIPKRGADPEKYKAASEAFSQLKKDAKQIITNKKNHIFEDFLTGKTISPDAWQASYEGSNPLLRAVAELVVWNQKGKTFILKGNQTIDSAGALYVIGQDPIGAAHPMEMAHGDVAAWQNYFLAHNLKQLFPQMWEPVYRKEDIRPDRYADCPIQTAYLFHREKHGITVRYERNAPDGTALSLASCGAEYAVRLDGKGNPAFYIHRFTCIKFDRQANHVISILDRLTIPRRIEEDDSAAVAGYLAGTTLAQISEYLDLAIKAQAADCTALLLEYKNKHFGGLDPMDSFSLED